MLVLKPEPDQKIVIRDLKTGEVIVEITFFYKSSDDGREYKCNRRLGFTADKRFNIYREKNRPSYPQSAKLVKNFDGDITDITENSQKTKLPVNYK